MLEIWGAMYSLATPMLKTLPRLAIEQYIRAEFPKKWKKGVNGPAVFSQKL